MGSWWGVVGSLWIVVGSLWVVPGFSNYDWGIVTTLWQITNWNCCFVIEPHDSYELTISMSIMSTQ